MLGSLCDILSVEETLVAVEVVLLYLQVRTGPHALKWTFLDGGQRAALARIRDTATAALLAAMPSGPEDQEWHHLRCRHRPRPELLPTRRRSPRPAGRGRAGPEGVKPVP